MFTPIKPKGGFADSALSFLAPELSTIKWRQLMRQMGVGGDKILGSLAKADLRVFSQGRPFPSLASRVGDKMLESVFNPVPERYMSQPYRSSADLLSSRGTHTPNPEIDGRTFSQGRPIPSLVSEGILEPRPVLEHHSDTSWPQGVDLSSIAEELMPDGELDKTEKDDSPGMEHERDLREVSYFSLKVGIDRDRD